MNKIAFKLTLLLLFLLPLAVDARGKTYEDIPSMAKSNKKRTDTPTPGPEGTERKSIDGIPVDVVINTPP